ncbi:MAG TPA: putative baseplate assembly protein, partial [Longimicrobium sp.]|nr:putative baseplate assembly protein [Longimicrobium sp.]
MSAALDESVRGLDDCGCCAGTDASTPLPVHNRPGLPAVAYRVGTHATFLESLRAGLSTLPALRGLGVRSGDFTLALLDAWATVGDVLTFYQERIANESWLRTATERRSVLELARAIGYELRPGVAAATHLAFTLEEAPGAPAEVTIVAGTKVQSLPGPKEAPQTFETGAAVVARPGWNAMRARQTEPQRIEAWTTGVWVKGAPAAVQPGDALLLVGAARETSPASTAWAFRFAAAVAPDAAAGRTWVTLDQPVGVDLTDGATLHALRQRAALFGHNAPDFRLLAVTTRRLFLGTGVNDPDPVDTVWPSFRATGDDDDEIDLDGVYPRVVPGGWIVLLPPNGSFVRRVQKVRERTRSAFSLSLKVTTADVDANIDPDDIPLRGTAVYVQSERLELAEAPIRELVDDDTVELEAGIDPLEPGREVIVRSLRPRVRALSDQLVLMDEDDEEIAPIGQGAILHLLAPIEIVPIDDGMERLTVRDAWGREGRFLALSDGYEILPGEAGGEEAAELAVIAEVEMDDPEHPVLVFRDPLRQVYDRATARVLGNVAPATHGETVAERLGSGDAGLAFQRFALRQKPLTHTPAEGPAGGESTLEVRVGDLKWREVPALYARGPRERVFTTRRQDDGTTTVHFGDGVEGARLPTGAENVRAVYRKGIGRVGNVRAGQLSLLMTRELGVKSVDNPVAASGGADPQEREDARANAPVTVLTLDRVVSLRDYEDFARAFSGVAKAHAVWTWEAGGRGVFLTVAGPDGDDVPEGGPLHLRLLGALAGAGDPRVPVRVRPYRRVPFRVAATVRPAPDRDPARVKAAVDDALRARFSFGARRFGEGVRLSEVMAAVQSVPGVLAVDVDVLARAGGGG